MKHPFHTGFIAIVALAALTLALPASAQTKLR